jgi:phosphatidylinositol-3-phosphatase
VSQRLLQTTVAGLVALSVVGCGGSAGSAPQAATHGSSQPSSRSSSLPSPTASQRTRVTSPRAHSSSTPAPVASPRPSSPGVSKLLVLVVENHSLDEMRSQMPWTYGLAHRYGYATAYRAMTHPSLPNYLAIAGGSTFGIHDDHDPSAHPISGPSVFGEALAHGRSARVYADAMASPCFLTSAGRYAVRHNPWTYFVDERTACRTFDTPLARFSADVRAGHLPDAGMVVPDLCHDAHDCSLATADAWLHQEVGLAMSGPDFRAGRLAIVVTADEDDGSQGNVVLTVVVHPSLDGVVATGPLSQLSLCRLYAEVLGVPLLRDSASAPSMATAFHLPLARR